jgi:hypothetical protein
MLNGIFPLCSQAAVQVASEMTVQNNLVASAFQAAAGWIDDQVTWYLVVN